MTNNLPRISLLRAQLIRQNIRVTNDWLEGCVDYFLQGNPEISDKQLLDETFEQFLLADLNEIGLACIPENVVRVKDLQTIEGRFTVQIQSIMNISESPYDLLQQLYNKKGVDPTDIERENNRNNRATFKKQRMLKLELTDGTHICHAMEYSSIPQLNVNMRPGTKVRIIGPLKCANNVLFLEAKNIEVLGGEVDVLLITNAFENMLLKALNKPLNPNPSLDFIETNQSQSQTQTQNRTMNETTAFNPNSTFNGMRTIDTYLTPNRNPTSNSRVVQQDPFEDEDDAIFADINLEQIIEQRAPVNETRPPPPPQVVVQPNRINFEDEYDEDMEDIEALAMIEQEILAQQQTARITLSPQPGPSNPKRSSTSPVPENSQASKVPKLTGLEDFEEVITLPDFTPPPILYHSVDYKFKLEGCNLLTFDQLKTGVSETDRLNKIFMFFATPSVVTKPLSITENNWILELTLEDVKDDTLQVKMDPKLLETLIGYEAKEIKIMRHKSKTHPNLKEEILDILSKFNTSLRQDRCFWKIKFFQGETLPTVISVVNLKPVYKKILLNKIDAENLTKLRDTVPN
uniref:RecQ-mediated genome instability protein 1 n=1 Tax=Culicoides sonorensis TaxID=179676 RepID=A0A336MGB2_CULSO